MNTDASTRAVYLLGEQNVELATCLNLLGTKRQAVFFDVPDTTR